MSSIPKRSLRTGVELSTLGFGGAPLGELFAPVSEPEAQETLQAAWDAGIRYYDTAPFYGYGTRDHRSTSKPHGRSTCSASWLAARSKSPAALPAPQAAGLIMA